MWTSFNPHACLIKGPWGVWADVKWKQCSWWKCWAVLLFLSDKREASVFDRITKSNVMTWPLSHVSLVSFVLLLLPVLTKLCCNKVREELRCHLVAALKCRGCVRSAFTHVVNVKWKCPTVCFPRLLLDSPCGGLQPLAGRALGGWHPPDLRFLRVTRSFALQGNRLIVITVYGDPLLTWIAKEYY